VVFYFAILALIILLKMARLNVFFVLLIILVYLADACLHGASLLG